MPRLVIEGFFYLLRTEWLLRQNRVEPLHEAVKLYKTSPRGRQCFTDDQICRAVDMACVFYFKRVLCLQRSAATTMLLRHYGHPAELVIGARVVPFKSHAWVELKGLVINDKSYTPQIYRELERC